ncbi:cyclin-dependent protein kinase inhibitor SMR8-like [Prosopis cineraria]|uniref:cyclin-dependent protein kinase inhibitor SMR8-like n=1 Tax=Prosopis cineraria TaxID=364024 RepID=UPI002410ABB5|nr:cyclin-dependent protein kinase inhibitor SMR8-like [Prosopis cineraria]
MGFSEKAHLDGAAAFDSDNRKWVLAGISLRPPLKPIYTIPAAVVNDKTPHQDDGDETDAYCTTPTSEEARLPTTFTCPPAPRKPKPSSKFNFRRGTRQFFNPPDLETVFIRCVEKAN